LGNPYSLIEFPVSKGPYWRQKSGKGWNIINGGKKRKKEQRFSFSGGTTHNTGKSQKMSREESPTLSRILGGLHHIGTTKKTY